MKNQKHGAGNNQQRTTHGIDYLFSYESPFSHRTLDQLIISVKYTSQSYPVNPRGKFKEHFLDLAKTMECFKGSAIRQSSSRQFSGIDKSREIGVLFWITNNSSDSDTIIKKVAGSYGIDDFNYESIYLVDNSCLSFIYDTIKYLLLNNSDSSIEFFYQNTGRNYNPLVKESSGKILPVEMINSNVILLKLNNKDESTTFVISASEDFHRDHLKRLIGLAYEITADFAKDTLILFPNFDRLQHENQVSEAKSSFRDRRFTDKVRVSSYTTDFRNINNEERT
jgi:hypothetical protein